MNTWGICALSMTCLIAPALLILTHTLKLVKCLTFNMTLFSMPRWLCTFILQADMIPKSNCSALNTIKHLNHSICNVSSDTKEIRYKQCDLVGRVNSVYVNFKMAPHNAMCPKPSIEHVNKRIAGGHSNTSVSSAPRASCTDFSSWPLRASDLRIHDLSCLNP